MPDDLFRDSEREMFYNPWVYRKKIAMQTQLGKTQEAAQAPMDGPGDRNPRNHENPPSLKGWTAGVVLVFLMCFLALLSRGFDYEVQDQQKPILWLVGVMMAAGIIHLFAVSSFRRIRLDRRMAIGFIALGLAMRMPMFVSTPMLEDDHYRYLWDGGVLASGFNPYRFSPGDVRRGVSPGIPEKLRQLAEEASPVPERINYPYLRTIYPPIVQVAFALGHLLAPWSLFAWRTLLLLCDGVTLWMLFYVLRKRRFPLAGLVVYWWNPLLVKEIYNSGHMDVLLFPLLLGSLIFTLKKRHLYACAALGVAVGVKFWPVILVPVILRSTLRNRMQLLLGILLFGFISLMLFLPMALSGLDASSGFVAYGKTWEMNDALFLLILWVAEILLRFLDLYPFHAQSVARAASFALVLGWTFWLIRKDTEDPRELNKRLLLVVAGLYFLSPTQFPWYSLWILPFLAVTPRLPFLVLGILLPLYYMRDYLRTEGLTSLHDNGIVWLEFAPVWFLLVWERLRGPLWPFDRKEKRIA